MNHKKTTILIRHLCYFTYLIHIKCAPKIAIYKRTKCTLSEGYAGIQDITISISSQTLGMYPNSCFSLENFNSP